MASRGESMDNLELELYFDDYEHSPRTKVIPVESVKQAKIIIKDYESDHDYQSADLYEVVRKTVSLD